MKLLFRASRLTHKWLGLLLIVFIGWMTVSGILLNHPDWISGLSVPRWLIPPQYRIHDWNRGALRIGVFSERDPSVAYVGGSQGVWKTTDGGNSFRCLDQGFPQSSVYRQVESLVLCEENPARLLAGTRGGLYVCDVDAEEWRRVPLGSKDEPVLKILSIDDDIVVFTPSHAYRTLAVAASLTFQETPLLRAGETGRSVSLLKLFFELHSGSIWGLAGRLLFDLAGLVLLFLCVSAFYIWYWPWRLRKQGRSIAPHKAVRTMRMQRWLVEYHLRLGIWGAVLLLIIGGTGFFMRPPMLAALVNGTVPADLYPGVLPDNPWHDSILNALYDEADSQVLIETRDGFWAGPADFGKPFIHVDLPAPVFVMGSTVLEPYGSSGFLVGSFSGLFHFERDTNNVIDLVAGRDADDISRMQPADVMPTGYLRTPNGQEYVAAHRQGLVVLGGAVRDGCFTMPEAMAREYRLPLWNFLFELHNGRIFKDLIGKSYALVVPLGSLLLLFVLFSGVFDWCYARFSGIR